jgi:predicted trehalose synthase
MKRNRLFLVLPILLLLLACGPPTVQQVAQGLNDLAKATSIAQTTIIEMNTQKLIDDDTTRMILEAFVKVNNGQKAAVAVTRQLVTIDQPTPAQLLGIIDPLTKIAQDLVDNGTIGIKNEEAKQRVRAVILTIQTTVNTLHLILSSGGAS